MLSGLVLIPQASGLNYASWFLFGFVFREQLSLVEVSGLSDPKPVNRVPAPSVPLPLVVEIQLHHFSWIGLWHCYQHSDRLLLFATA